MCRKVWLSGTGGEYGYIEKHTWRKRANEIVRTDRDMNYIIHQPHHDASVWHVVSGFDIDSRFYMRKRHQHIFEDTCGRM